MTRLRYLMMSGLALEPSTRRGRAGPRRHQRWGIALTIGLLFSALQTWSQRNTVEAAGVALFPAGLRPAGYKLGLLATACSMGGVWSDAEGVPPSDWRNRDDQRCKDLAVSVYGRFDPARYEQLRAGDAQAVSDLLAKIRATEPAATRERTVSLFRDVAAAMHEGMLARRASDRVKVDYDADAVEAKMTDDERTAAKALFQHGALDRLLATTDATATDRRLLGLLAAMDRMEMARGLPKQLKFYALGHVLTTVFDVAPPPTDALKPTAIPLPGTWLDYLSGVASRAGYPASDSPALTHKMRETLAWTGVGRGFADRIRRQVATLPNAAVPELSRIATEVAARLEKERATAETMSKAHAQNGGAK
jgi:hypothetical protein